MSDAYEIVKRFQDGLQPHIKPREQTNYIRRILALHVSANTRDGLAKQPLPLANAGHEPSPPSAETIGAYKEYAEALRVNATAQRQFDDAVQVNTDVLERRPTSDGHKGQFLDEQVTILRLRQKKQKLSIIQRYLDQLLEEPAASPNVLDPDRIFEGSKPLPSVPKEVVNSLVAEKGQNAPDTRDRRAALDKTFLRARLFLRQQEKLLQDTKARTRDRPDVPSNAAKLAALNATRNELINWIETELSLASTEDPAQTPEKSKGSGDVALDPSTIDAGLSGIKAKYSQYLNSRRELVSLASREPNTAALPDLSHTTSSPEAAQASSVSLDYLISPYIKMLMSLSNDQKALIAQKSHMNAVLSRQTKDTCQGLGHLAEESQLLPSYPMKDSLRRRSRLMDELTAKQSELPDLATRIRPWVFGADAAKIGKLESAAETIESGQIALEAAIKVLEDVERLLGIHSESTQQPEDHSDVANDFWLEADNPKGKFSRKHTDREHSERKTGDIWAALQGNLGLIGHEDTA